MKKKAIILLSGGMDSSTVLAYARHQGFACYALTINYGQRNIAELAAAKKQALLCPTREHRIISVEISAWGGSALTDKTLPLPTELSDTIPTTYVPARNAIFLSLAASWAETIGATDIFCGANQVDYSNYPDCREAFLQSFEIMLNTGTKKGMESVGFTIHAPLLKLNKGAIIELGVSLGVRFEETVSCYNATPSGLACGKCAACQLRKKGFHDAELADCTLYA